MKWYIGHKPEKYKKAVYKDPANGQWRLTIDEKKRILTTHIFGVDIDAQAVEVTKLLAAVEGAGGRDRPEPFLEPARLSDDRALPNLADNIKCGNSLIGPDYFTGKLFPDPEEMKRVNPFRLEAGLPRRHEGRGL